MSEPAASSDSLRAALLTAAAGVLTTLITLLVGWLHTRSADSRRTSAIEEAGKRVQFLEAWYRTRMAVVPDELEESRRLVLQQLDAVMDHVQATETLVGKAGASEEWSAHVSKLSWVRRWLLFYRPVRPLAWLPRAFFYLSAVYLTYGCLATIDVILTDYRWPALLRVNLINYSRFLAIVLATTLLVRWFAVFVDKKTAVAMK